MAEKTGAILEDGSAVVVEDGEVVVEDAVEEILSERDLMMLEIEQQLSGEISDEEITVTQPVVVEGKSLSSKALTDETLVAVKIDGKEELLPLSKVTEGFQKASVGSKRLEQAAELKRSLDAREQGLTAKELALAEKEKLLSTPVINNDDDGDVDIDDQLSILTEALVEGDNDAAKEVLKGLIKTGDKPVVAAPVVDVEAIATDVASRVSSAQAEKAAQDDALLAWSEFEKTNNSFSNPESKERKMGDYIFDTVYGPQMQAGEISYREALSKTAEDVFEHYPLKEPVKDAATLRAEKKAAIVNLPTASSRAAKIVDREETPDEIVASMAADRGQ